MAETRMRVETAMTTQAQLLREEANFSCPVQLLESKAGNLLAVRGEFGRADEPTQNRRLYRKALWERELRRMGPLFEQRRMYGELDHPDDGKTKLARASHIVTSLKLENGKVIGEAEILPTAAGRDLAAILNAGCQVGVSSRGYGTTRRSPEGYEVVNEDYRLVTFDFVADPADRNAYPKVVRESLEEGARENGEALPPLFEGIDLQYLLECFGGADLEDELDEERPERSGAVAVSTEDDNSVRVEVDKDGKVKAITVSDDEDDDDEDDDDSDEYDVVDDEEDDEDDEDDDDEDEDEDDEEVEEDWEQLHQDLTLERALPTDEDRAHLLSEKAQLFDSVCALLSEHLGNEVVAAAFEERDHLIATQKARIRELELVVQGLQEEMEEVTNAARQVGYMCYLERELANHPYAKEVRRVVGDVGRFESTEDLKKVVSESKASFEAVAEHLEEEQEDLREENAQLVRLLKRATALIEEHEVAEYGAKRAAKHPKSREVKDLLESVKPTSREQVDAIVENKRPKRRGREEMSELSARIRRRLGGSMSPSNLDEQEGSHRPRPRRRSRQAFDEVVDRLPPDIQELVER